MFAAGEGEDRHNQGAGLQAGWLGDDLQADGGCRGEVEEAKRAHLVALVRAGARFGNGELVDGSEEKAAA